MNHIFGKSLIIIGLIIALMGVLIYYKDSFHFLKFFGRLPGDIYVKRENFTFYFPVATSIIISMVLSLILYLFNRFR